MTDDTAAFPSLYEYALARRCTRCGAEPGLPCNAPRKHDEIAARNRIRSAVRRPPVGLNLLHLLHLVRIDAGSRHRDRDVAAAPWPEDRESEWRYDTLDQLREERPSSA
ncbi:hypothetical protein [Streptomyces sp. NPDC052036]|uniref:hypothetical protein n=1 Tax=Streptomyces sp. NPDC052036 TaxID=3155171 RepID=UPI0034283DDD